jgi:hypothetical protein
MSSEEEIEANSPFLLENRSMEKICHSSHTAGIDKNQKISGRNLRLILDLFRSVSVILGYDLAMVMEANRKFTGCEE